MPWEVPTQFITTSIPDIANSGQKIAFKAFCNVDQVLELAMMEHRGPGLALRPVADLQLRQPPQLRQVNK